MSKDQNKNHKNKHNHNDVNIPVVNALNIDDTKRNSKYFGQYVNYIKPSPASIYSIKTPVNIHTIIGKANVTVPNARVKPHPNGAGTTIDNNGFTPAQIRTAYNIPDTPSGKNQVIAIIDPYDYPNAFSDLDFFCNYFLINRPNLITNISQLTSTPPTGKFNFLIHPMYTGSIVDTSWDNEKALDLQWSHAAAQDAAIVLVLAASSALGDMFAAAQWAVNTAGATVVSMSFGVDDEIAKNGANQSPYVYGEAFFSTAKPAIYIASTGDKGKIEYPATSQYILAVGGTTLTLNSDNSIATEIGWTGSGGGISDRIILPPYQNANLPSNIITLLDGTRGIPDVSIIADAAHGVAVYINGQWYSVGGTSLSAPVWAGIMAMTNEARISNGKPIFVSNNPTNIVTNIQSALYNLIQGASGSSATAYIDGYFSDITAGKNAGFSAVPGYDLVTGIGTPNIANLITYLQTYVPI